MPTFRVDSLEIQRCGQRLMEISAVLQDIVPQFGDLANLASATGDANCAQAFTAFVQQWQVEIATSALAVAYFSNKITYAANEYVFTEAAIADTEVYYFDTGTL